MATVTVRISDRWVLCPICQFITTEPSEVRRLCQRRDAYGNVETFNQHSWTPITARSGDLAFMVR